jgi:predicted O-methyltransferase YrrM
MLNKIKKNLIKFYRFINREYVLLDENSIKKPLGSKKKYLEIFNKASNLSFKEIDTLQNNLGFTLNKEWLDNLALHTQVCIKKSQINYQHGKILYAYLRHYLQNHSYDYVNIFETGTGRGFSSTCMSKALNDSQTKGKIHTIDLLPNDKKMYWNTIDDHEKKKTRFELLANWPLEHKNINFLTGQTKNIILNLKLERINFAFLDAEHSYQSVILEYDFVKKRQKKGDIIFFDDVTENAFPGICKAIKNIDKEKLYSIKYLNFTDQRQYAIATKL